MQLRNGETGDVENQFPSQPQLEAQGIDEVVDLANAPWLFADREMLKRALLNLALNACQAMPDGGALKLACRATSKRRVEVDIEDTGSEPD